MSCATGRRESDAILFTVVVGRDRPEFYGIGGGRQEKAEVAEYIENIRCNSPMRRLMVAGAGRIAPGFAPGTTVDEAMERRKYTKDTEGGNIS